MSDAADLSITIVPLDDGRYQVVSGEARRVAYAAVARETWVFLDGRVYIIDDDAGRSPRSRTDTQDALSAPMPATVLAIHVSPGQQVAKNDLVMVLEAMKMELPIRSPRDGTVARVTCSVGELVPAGATLMALDDGVDVARSGQARKDEKMEP